MTPMFQEKATVSSSVRVDGTLLDNCSRCDHYKFCFADFVGGLYNKHAAIIIVFAYIIGLSKT